MRLFATVVVLAGASCALAQTGVATTPVQKPMDAPRAPIRRSSVTRTAPPATVAADASAGTPVVTIDGVCKERQAKGACKTLLTREDLDGFISVFAPEAANAPRGRLAVQYARAVALSTLAEQQGLGRDPALEKEIDRQLRLTRMRLLANAYLKRLQRPALPIPEPEIQKYFSEHKNLYDQVQVRRLAVPFVVPTEDGRPLDRAAVKAEMEDVRKRALAGEDLNQLQLDAYRHLRIQVPPPPVNSMVLRRSNLQGDEAKAFDLNPGEISPVFDSLAAIAIIKLESKEPMLVDSVRTEIEAAIRRDRMQNDVKKLTKNITSQFDLQYLELPSQPDLFDLTTLGPSVSRSVRRSSSPRRQNGSASIRMGASGSQQ
jgi:hypothetical protein